MSDKKMKPLRKDIIPCSDGGEIMLMRMPKAVGLPPRKRGGWGTNRNTLRDERGRFTSQRRNWNDAVREAKQLEREKEELERSPYHFLNEDEEEGTL